MLQKRILCLVLCLVCCLGLVGGAIASEVECDGVYCFERGDFAQSEELTGICITGLPDAAAGTVMLGSRVLQEGDILTVQQIGEMTFVPLDTRQDLQACISYLPIYPDRVESDATMTISILGKEDQPPVAENSTLETYKNLPNQGKLKATDPEGKAMTYSVIRQPRRGTVTLKEDGSFTYTPKKNKVGTDSFTYTATDPAGQVSREATVTVEILKPTQAGSYTDTANTSCRFTAEWMKNTGLFVAEQVGGTACFQPQKVVNRGEFLTMLVKTLKLPVEETADYTGFSDDTPDWLKPYLAAALRSGMTENWPEQESFGAAEPITGAQAAVLIQNALDLTVPTLAGKENEDELPVWASSAIEAVAQQGITLDPMATLTREDTAGLLYQISQLSKSTTEESLY